MNDTVQNFAPRETFWGRKKINKISGSDVGDEECKTIEQARTNLWLITPGTGLGSR